MAPLKRRLFLLTTAALLTTSVCTLPGTQKPETFPTTIGQLSEPGGYFNTNNLVSNEKSYLHVIPALREARLDGGVYLGVGPDQNFSYIAQTRPAMAFIVDIRRDNMLLHLLFKALFRMSSSRADYLSMLFGRPPPTPAGKWKAEDIERIASYLDGVPPSAEATASLRARADAVIKKFGVELSAEDLATIDLFHRTFVDRGLSLQFESAGRPPRSYYPTYRELLLETDRNGRRWNYLASESDFQFVKSLQDRDLVIPVVGDLAGTTAMAAIGRLMRERGDRLSVFYTSNVEYYLANRGLLQRFVDNLQQLPHNGKSVIIRSVFPNRYGWAQTMPGYISASHIQRVDDLVEGTSTGRIREYGDLINGISGR